MTWSIFRRFHVFSPFKLGPSTVPNDPARFQSLLLYGLLFSENQQDVLNPFSFIFVFILFFGNAECQQPLSWLSVRIVQGERRILYFFNTSFNLVLNRLLTLLNIINRTYGITQLIYTHSLTHTNNRLHNKVTLIWAWHVLNYSATTSSIYIAHFFLGLALGW